MTADDPAIKQLRKQARWVRIQGTLAVAALSGIAILLLYLMFGQNFTPLPFTLGVSAFGDANYGLGSLPLPVIIARVFEKTLAAVVCIYIIQLTVMFARYFLRIAEHIEMCANVVLIAVGDAEKIAIIATALLPSTIDFGKTPRSPIENLAQEVVRTAREIATKPPEKST